MSKVEEIVYSPSVMHYEGYDSKPSNEEIEKESELLQSIVDEYNKHGFIYIKYIASGKKGSIAKLYLDIESTKETDLKVIINDRKYFTDSYRIDIDLNISYGRVKFDGRKNNYEEQLYSRDVVWLKGYEGETVWCKADVKKEKEKALALPIYDINNDVIKVGDSVVYINARYGTGMRLCNGIIDRLEAKYSERDNSTEVSVIVKEIGRDDMESKITKPNEFIYRMSETK